MPQYRSKFERRIAQQIRAKGEAVEYETYRLTYTRPATEHSYTPDFWLGDIAIECKGRFTAADRKKHLLVRDSHPDLDLRFVFMNANNRLSRNSTTTYAAWCDKHGFRWAHKEIPEEWFDE